MSAPCTCGDVPRSFTATLIATLHCNVALYDTEAPGRWWLVGLGLHFATDFFDLAEDSQNITAKNLFDIFGAVSAIEKSLRNLWQVGSGILPLGRGSAHPVEVGTQADVIDTGNFSDVVNVVD